MIAYMTAHIEVLISVVLAVVLAGLGIKEAIFMSFSTWFDSDD